MRQVLVDHAGLKLADKRGGDLQHRVELREDIALTNGQSEEILALHEALEHLEDLDERQARIVEMHYFVGNPVEEIAGALKLSERTIKRELQTARMFSNDNWKGRGCACLKCGTATPEVKVRCMSHMSPERWRKIKQLLDLALEREPNQRNVFLAEACASDTNLLLEVESMLARVSSGAGVLDGPVWEQLGFSPGSLNNESLSERRIPKAIGRYRVLRLLGEGGMGAVYEAEQDQPRRTVALKIIKPGLAAPELLRRFELESQALARLHHPGVAQVYDAGTADTGFGPQPYFAMELIQGEPLPDFAETRHLTPHQRLAGLINIRVGRTGMLGWIRSLGGAQRLAAPVKDGFLHP